MSNFNELKNIPFATKFLGDHLKEGTLVLFLGAGTSKGFGLPVWVGLVNSLRKFKGLTELTGNPSAEDLQNAADEVISSYENTTQLTEQIKKILYSNLPILASSTIFERHLLISISALLMGSKRGHITKVVTLNYDNMLEWFLSIFGFVVKTIYDLPELEGSEDVRIYHPHGFIPHPDSQLKSSDFVILGMDSVNERLGTPGDPWFEMTRHILNTSVCLFIGMSENTLSDRALAPLFVTSGKLHSNKRPLGIWLLKGQLSQVNESKFDRNNIISISISDENEISNFILKICQEAAVTIK